MPSTCEVAASAASATSRAGSRTSSSPGITRQPPWRNVQNKPPPSRRRISGDSSKKARRRAAAVLLARPRRRPRDCRDSPSRPYGRPALPEVNNTYASVSAMIGRRRHRHEPMHLRGRTLSCLAVEDRHGVHHPRCRAARPFGPAVTSQRVPASASAAARTRAGLWAALPASIATHAAPAPQPRRATLSQCLRSALPRRPPGCSGPAPCLREGGPHARPAARSAPAARRRSRPPRHRFPRCRAPRSHPAAMPPCSRSRRPHRHPMPPRRHARGQRHQAGSTCPVIPLTVPRPQLQLPFGGTHQREFRMPTFRACWPGHRAPRSGGRYGGRSARRRSRRFWKWRNSLRCRLSGWTLKAEVKRISVSSNPTKSTACRCSASLNCWNT